MTQKSVSDLRIKILSDPLGLSCWNFIQGERCVCEILPRSKDLNPPYPNILYQVDLVDARQKDKRTVYKIKDHKYLT